LTRDGARLTLVVAVADNGVIGRAGALPWHLPEDLRHFKNVTMGHAVIMGRKTYESIGRVLPGRRFVVVSRDPDLRIDGALVAHDLDEAIARAREHDPDPRVIGGSAVFEAALPRASTILLTEVHRDVEGDVYFPPFDRRQWCEAERRKGETEGLEFVRLERAGAPA
jgi:dihydrofolate reductase